MNAREISLQIDQVVEMLKTHLRQHPVHAAFESFFREIERLHLDDVPSLEVLTTIFGERYDATIKLKNPEEGKNNGISPLHVYCRESNADINSLNSDFIDFYSRVIYTFHLLYRQKYLLKQYEDVKAPYNIFEMIGSIDQIYIEEAQTCSEEEEHCKKVTEEFYAFISQLVLQMQKIGYLPSEGENLVHPASQNAHTPFTDNIMAWLKCLPSDVPHPVEDENDPDFAFTSLAQQTYQFATRAKAHGNQHNLYDYHFDGIAKALQMRKIIKNLEGKMSRYFIYMTNFTKEMHEISLVQNEYQEKLKPVMAILRNLRQILTTMKKNVLTLEANGAVGGALELHLALKSVCQHFKLSEEDSELLLSLRHELRYFSQDHTQYDDDLKSLISNAHKFMKHRATHQKSAEHLQRQVATAKECWQQCVKAVDTAANTYAKITLLDVKVNFRQHAFRNIGFAILGALLFGSVASLVGVFALTLSPLLLGVTIAAAAFVGANLFFWSGVLWEYRHLSVKPDTPSVALNVDKYLCRLPKDEKGLKFDWEKELDLPVDPTVTVKDTKVAQLPRSKPALQPLAPIPVSFTNSPFSMWDSSTPNPAFSLTNSPTFSFLQRKC